jgi:guanine deaminase
MKAFVGTLVHTPTTSSKTVASNPSNLISILLYHCIIINNNGSIVHLGPSSSFSEALKSHPVAQDQIHHLSPKQFLIPGFIDCHIHAPQYSFTGTRTDLPLFQWLKTYTFPSEAQLQDLNLARKVYTAVVKRLLSLGTTTAAYFTTLHQEPCEVLVDVVHELGQRAVLGKVSMDQHSPEGYIEGTRDGLRAAAEVAEYVKVSCSKRRGKGLSGSV